MQTNQKKTKNLTMIVFVGVLSAIIFVMAFTPLGYLKTPAFSITFLLIPVSIGAVLFGPAAGAILGGVFGLTSFIQCFGLEPLGTVLLGINPIAAFITCMVPRILVGLLTAYIFKALQKIDKTQLVSYGVACLSSALLNTVLFIGCLLLFFFRPDSLQTINDSLNTAFSSANIMGFISALVGFNGLIEAGVCFVLGTALTKTLSVLGRIADKKRAR